MIKDLKTLKREMWAEAEKDYGQRIPEEFKNIVENTMLHGIYDEVGLDDLRGQIPNYLKLFTLGFNIGKRLHETEPKDNTPKRNRYQRPFEKQVYLVNFVARKFLNIKNLLDRSLTPHSRIKWQSLASEWNTKHLNDPITPAGLKLNFYRAIKDGDVRREFFLRWEEKLRPSPLFEIIKVIEESKKDYETMEKDFDDRVKSARTQDDFKRLKQELNLMKRILYSQRNLTDMALAAINKEEARREEITNERVNKGKK
jgi:hypothetical protein